MPPTRLTFVRSPNSEALDLICHRYNCGSPSQYLAGIDNLLQFQFDYAMAKRHMHETVRTNMDELQKVISGLGSQPDATHVSAVVLKWLVAITSSK